MDIMYGKSQNVWKLYPNKKTNKPKTIIMISISSKKKSCTKCLKKLKRLYKSILLFASESRLTIGHI